MESNRTKLLKKIKIEMDGELHVWQALPERGMSFGSSSQPVKPECDVMWTVIQVEWVVMLALLCMRDYVEVNRD